MNNSKTKTTITRRQFIRDTSMATIGSTLFLDSSHLLFSDSSATVPVVLVRDLNVLDQNGFLREKVVLEMLDAAVTALTGKTDPTAAWKSIIKPEDIVGIKSNKWQYIPTTIEVENSLKKRVMDAGVPATHIAIDDWEVLNNPIFQRATALINARPMRTHHWAGVGSLIKNYIMFAPTPSAYHDDSCANLAKVWDFPIVKGKTRLNVLVMFTPQFHGVGPHGFSPKYVWKYYGVIAGFDPVAVDSVGLRIIQAKRKEYFAEERPLNPPAKHIFLADTRFHLGTADPTKIKLIKIGYDKDTLL